MFLILRIEAGLKSKADRYEWKHSRVLEHWNRTVFDVALSWAKQHSGALGKLGDWGINPWTHVVAQKKHHQIRWKQSIVWSLCFGFNSTTGVSTWCFGWHEKTSSDPCVYHTICFFETIGFWKNPSRVRQTEAPKPCRERNLSDGVSGTVYQSLNIKRRDFMCFLKAFEPFVQFDDSVCLKNDGWMSHIFKSSFYSRVEKLFYIYSSMILF